VSISLEGTLGYRELEPVGEERGVYLGGGGYMICVAVRRELGFYLLPKLSNFTFEVFVPPPSVSGIYQNGALEGGFY